MFVCRMLYGFGVVLVMVDVSNGAPQNLLEAEVDQEGENKNVVNNIWEFARVSGPISPHAQSSPLTAAVGGDATGGASSFSGLSPCENAIASCCGANNLGRRASCFEILGCEGAWFGDLCRTELQREVYREIALGFSVKK
ncbi:unnamed protein product [Meganyctiphanes norvegica]|uniref:Uncharacterized protein n=1 Tax=Meganyctiphanes norvegica TaxID=48144 RepID=A0AAV2QEF0_MEGNR